VSDTGQDIEVESIMSIEELINLQADTQGRFSFNMHGSGVFADCMWVNYYKDSRGYRVKRSNGSWKLLEFQNKQVIIGVES
jgi:hypothetical protein